MTPAEKAQHLLEKYNKKLDAKEFSSTKAKLITVQQQAVTDFQALAFLRECENALEKIKIKHTNKIESELSNKTDSELNEEALAKIKKTPPVVTK